MSTELSPIQRRTVQIVAHRGGKRFSLTGFVVAEHLVLTCAHDVVDADTLEVCAGVNRDRLLSARVIWRPDSTSRLDMAVLSVPVLNLPIEAPIAWGEIAGVTRVVAGYGYGYPAANRDAGDEGPTGKKYHVAHLPGEIVPGEGTERGRMVFRIKPGQVSDDETWGGCSGMAVFDGDNRLLGVVTDRLTGWHNRWDLVPATQIRRAAGLPEALRELPYRRIEDYDSPLEPAYHPHAGLVTDLKLLTARYGQVPFVGTFHRPYLDELLAWTTGTDRDRYSISVLTGPAGSGKTRLAAELCTELLNVHSGWEAGFATTDPDAEWSRFLPRRPTLVVFDYSDRGRSRANVIAWLRFLDSEANASPSVRILLIERAAGSWLSDLDHRTRGLVSELRRGGLDLDLRGSPDEAAPPFDAEQRREHALAAYRRFRAPEEQGRRTVDELLDFVADDRVDSPLLVHIAALLAARDQPLPNRTETNTGGLRDRLLSGLLWREREKRWNEHPTLNASASPTADQVLHAVCIANLTKPDLHELDDLLTASPLWGRADTSPAERRVLAEAVYDLYPGPRRLIDGQQSVPTVGTLEPDLVSEHLVATLREDDIAVIIERLHGLGLRGGHIERMLHLAALTADHYPSTSKVFDDTVDHFLRQTAGTTETADESAAHILATRLGHLVRTTASKYADTGEQSVASLLSTTLQFYGDLPEISKAAAQLDLDLPYPSPNRQIADLASQLATLAVRHLEQSGEKWELAVHLNELGYRLGELGFHADALPHLQRAVSIRQNLKANAPDHDPAIRAALAFSLNHLGAALSALGRPVEALPHLQQAAELYGSVADEVAVLPAIARSLNNLGQGLIEVGRHAEALPHLQRAVELHRALVEDDQSLRAGLAGSLNNLYGGYRSLGRGAEALPYLQQSVELYEFLAEENFSRIPELVHGLNNLGSELNEHGRYAEAVQHLERALELCGPLADDNPAHRPLLANTLTNLGQGLVRSGGHTEGLPKLRRAVELYDSLTEDNPGLMPKLAIGLNNLGHGLAEFGRPAEALPHLERAVRLRKELCDANDAHYPDLAMSFQNHGWALGLLGRYVRARPLHKQAVEILEPLAEENPAHIPRLIRSLSSLGSALDDLGRHREALPYLRRAVDLGERLDHNPETRPIIAFSLHNLGCGLAAVGNVTDSHVYLRRANEMLGCLAKDNPTAYESGFELNSTMLTALNSRLAKRDKARTLKKKRRRRRRKGKNRW